jgi:hypothetical protein
MHVVALAVQLYQLGLEVGADLGEDRSECFDRFAIKDAVAAFGEKDQMDVHCRGTVSAMSKVLASWNIRPGAREFEEKYKENRRLWRQLLDITWVAERMFIRAGRKTEPAEIDPEQ